MIVDYFKENVATEVDLNAFGYSQKYSWLFSVFIKFNLVDKTQEKYEEFLDTKASIIQTVELDEAARYVGARIDDGWTELYFYARDSKSLGNKVSEILSSLEYAYETHVVKDAKWEFYNHNLYPSDMEFHHIESQRIIDLLLDEEDDLSVERPVEHYVYFDTPTQKDRFIENLSIEGFSYKDDIASEDFDNGVAIVKMHNAQPETVAKVVEELCESLKKEHGYYEGWSTVLAAEIE